MTSQAATSRFRLLIALLIALLGGLAATGCTIIEENTPPEECEAQPLRGINPATGECEWASSCDAEGWAPCGSEEYECSEIPADLCALDDRCEVAMMGACPAIDCDPASGACPDCTTEEVCIERHVASECEGLDEQSCLAAPGCEPEYGVIGAATRPAEGDAGAPLPEEDALPPEEWGYIGCYEPPTSRCDGLGEAACIDAPGCEPYYASEPCDCGELPPGAQGDIACNCADIARFAGCGEVPTQSCYDIYEPDRCAQTPGCGWFEDLATPGADPVDDICLCEDGDEDCGCGGMGAAPYPGGYCGPTDLPQSCYDVYDPNTCEDTPGCAWFDGFGGGVDEPTCACPEGAECDCIETAPELIAGYCGPEDQPRTCWDYYDFDQCRSNGCEWVNENVVEPCTCEPNGDCLCPGDGERIAWGYCQPPRPEGCSAYYDQYSCSSDPSCEWEGFGGGALPENPCDCAPDDSNCGCDILPYPEEGICRDREIQPDGCETYYDEYSCNSNPDCAWTPEQGGGGGGLLPPCDCEPDDPACTCIIEPPICDCAIDDPNCACTDPAPPLGGYCSTRDVPPPPACEYYDAFSCNSDPSCMWNSDAGGALPIAPPECGDVRLDADGICYNAEGFEVDPYCCDQGDPIPEGYCTPTTITTGCDALGDEASCLDSGCSWELLAVPCFCDDPDLGCECPEVGVCR